MSFDYLAKRNTAEALIEKFGESINLIDEGNDGGFDSFGDEIPPEPDVTFAGIMTPILSYARAEVDGETIQMGDGYVFFHSDTAPTIGAKATINSKVWRVIDIEELTSVGGINVYRKLQLRSDG